MHSRKSHEFVISGVTLWEQKRVGTGSAHLHSGTQEKEGSRNR